MSALPPKPQRQIEIIPGTEVTALGCAGFAAMGLFILVFLVVVAQAMGSVLGTLLELGFIGGGALLCLRVIGLWLHADKRPAWQRKVYAHGRAEEDLASLRKLEIRPPTWDSSLGKFAYPPHFCFSFIRPVSDQEVSSPQFSMARLADEALEFGSYRPAVVFFLDLTTVEEEPSELVDQLEENGLAWIARHCKGRWLSRDPYGLWKYGDSTKWEYVTEPAPEMALEEMHGLRPSIAALIERRFHLFDRAVGGCELYRSPGRLFLPEPIPPQVSPGVLTELELPRFDGWLSNCAVWKILPGEKTSYKALAGLLEALRLLEDTPFLFEIVKEGSSVWFQFYSAGSPEWAEEQLRLCLPECEIEGIYEPGDDEPLHVRYLNASNPYAPLKRAAEFKIDPYQQLLAVMDALPAETSLRVQVLMMPFGQDTIPKLAELVGDYTAVTEDAAKREVTHRASSLGKKLPAWLFSLRMASNDESAVNQAHARFIQQYETPEMRFDCEDVPANDSWFIRWLHWADWSVASSDELLTIAHLPDPDVTCESLERASVTTKAKLPPELYTTAGPVLGESRARGVTQTVTLPSGVRDRHCYIIGKSGTGKSTLLYNLVMQDIAGGDGVGVVDPHGDLVDDILASIPEHRIKDTIYFNAEDRDYPIGLNILSAETDAEMELIEGDLIAVFQRLTEGWGPQMESVLRNTVATLLRVPKATFYDIRNLLVKADFRQRALANFSTQDLLDFWQEEWPALEKRGAAQPILNRMTRFVRSTVLSGILSQAEAKLSLSAVMNMRKILLVKLSPTIGEENQKLLGSLLVSQMQLAAMRRSRIPKEQRVPFYLYVDEFQNFTNPAFETILSEARKYRLCLTLAHQFTSQLTDGIRKAIFGNVGTMMVFQVGKDDAFSLRNEVGSYDQEDLINLDKDKHQALCRPSTKATDTFLFETYPPMPNDAGGFAEEIIESTRRHYSKPVEAEGETESADDAGESAGKSERTYKPSTADGGSLNKRPATAAAKAFGSRKEMILYYVQQADYLTGEQIRRLCYSDVKDSARAAAASRDLTSLVSENKLRSKKIGSGKLYFVAARVNETAHNLAVRDLFIKIVQSGFEIHESNFALSLGSFVPDLFVSFFVEDGSLIPTFWEYDTGTEGMNEISKKLDRYRQYATSHRICFVAASRARARQLTWSITYSWVQISCIEDFDTLADSAFRRAGEQNEPGPFWS